MNDERPLWRSIARYCSLSLLFLLVCGRLHADDVLLVEKPAALIVYNAYQQRATDAERRSLVPFVPMRVVDPHVVMSDGFTVCMKVDVRGSIFFLLTEGGVLAGKEYGAVRTIRSVTLLGDTVHVLPRQTLLAEPPSGGGPVRYGGGTPLVRYFRSGDRTYVQRLDESARFGWVALHEGERGKVWDRVRRAAVQETGVPERLTTSVREALTSANAALQSLYLELNRESGRQLTPPVWRLEVAPDGLTCLLEGASPNAFQRSTEQLARSLENLVLGSGYEVSVGEERITVKKK